MTEQQKIKGIREVLEKKFLEPEFLDFFYVDAQVSKGDKVEIFIDSDTVLDLGACTHLNKHLQKFLDEEQLFGEKYTLEVSSPGTDRPLSFYRQYLKNRGRNVKVCLKDGSEVEGKMTKVDEKEILLVQKKKKETVESVLQIDDIKEIYVLISFK